MSILISGSVAFDTIIQTVWNFRSQDNKENPHLHLSLFSPLIRREYGWTAANIAYSLALLGRKSHIIASVGEDGIEYITRLQELGINTELMQVIPGSYSPQAHIIRDEDEGQINVFHAGAMASSGELTHGTIPFQYAIVAPDAKEGMIRRVNECTQAWITTIFDPGQAMGIYNREELRSMAVLADITIMNEPERIQFEDIVWEDFTSICLAHGHTGIVTLGEKWAVIKSKMSEILIPAIYVDAIVDATGCGDAFRAGLLYGLSNWWKIEKAWQLWNILWGIKIWYMGWQNHNFSLDDINVIGEREFGIKFFD